MSREQEYIAHVEKSFENAEKGISKLPQEILDMEGMTGMKTRHFYNNLLELDGAKYLEIGTWSGSSICAAMYGNKVRVVGMDNWAAFGGPKDVFSVNFNKYKGDNDATFIEHDCFTIDNNTLHDRFNIYLFDADHSSESQKRAVTYYKDWMEDVFIYVVDDWNYEEVRIGTLEGISQSGLSIVWDHQIRLTEDNSHTEAILAKTSWHNGIAVFVLKK